MKVALRLKRRGEAVPLSELLGSVGSRVGRERMEELSSRAFPHFEPAPGSQASW